jgi:hypothetical protein
MRPSAMRGSQVLRCSSVPPTMIGSVAAGHLLAHTADVAGAAAQTAGRFGQEDQVQAHVRRQELLDQLVREDILLVELQDLGVRQLARHHLPEGLQDHLGHLGSQSGGTGHGIPP